ncbi:Arginine utilization protein RocB [Rubellimicrobium mesophilum DSM 19309]|uniref:Arginine utilization protein RocB n=1 Tax=Rubellimicrobium mesophilum DSM 19309 TaxID=442562 RepID=A0A017HEW6_9RHOB|nr:M20/M25/M40 family metallo-hydrolase [Rubellimicrobium mesophilum]EYD72906.1 Arginine utilization protein RocB [Rubellimicrobium mesophilum DSM 19309]
MNDHPDPFPFEELCRDLALRLTGRPSVTGTPDEAGFGPWLAEILTAESRLGPTAEVWTFPVEEGDPRLCVACMVRGSGRATVLLTGHYDTVTTSDYGDLEEVALRPEELAPRLRARLESARPGSAEWLAREDLASGRFLPGRGLLDMKAGLAAGLSAMAAFAADPRARGNLLFIAVPDEENASAGARRAAVELGPLARERGLEIRLAVNLDAIADDGDGTAGRVVALGTVGKVLPTAFVVGAPVHSGFPLRGLNAAVLAAALAQRLEWAPELTDETAAEPGTPVSLLSLKDGKAGYDVTTPGTAFAYWNVLNHRRDPARVLDIVEALAREAVRACVEDLHARALRSGQPSGPIATAPEVPILRYSQLLARVRATDAAIDQAVAAEGARLAATGMPFPDICQVLTAMLWTRSGLSGPAIVLGLGSTPYLATELADPRTRADIDALLAEAPARHGTSLHAVDYFAGISDMSFFGQGDAGAFARLAPETPAWDTCVRLGPSSLAGVPTVNLGPWGRDYHTPLERIEADYGFRVLPRLLFDLATRVLRSGGVTT